ncbi:unnamed protein product [Caenorhabditis angaria]|uniref:General transcription factor IIH subunit 3 n=1 Tax=Caenorhabditis angaria TaxID=860376 RepID=A0A9P1IH14_9PELO|nr:unnamed protein product [Caenorhabditis angaria]
MSLSAANQLLVFAYGRNIKNKLLYCSSRPGDRDASSLIIERLREVLIESAESDDLKIGVPLAPAMTHAICYMKKDNKRITAEACADSLNTANPTSSTNDQSEESDEKSITRAVVIGITPVCGGEHSSLMNLFFSAAKQNICVDVISLADDNNGGILQQAADITGGLFLHTPNPTNLLKVLMTHVLADPAYRASFPQPTLDSVDYRASCACHHQLVSNGWVCSVCLSVLCQYMPICKVCKSVFKMTHLPKKILKRKRKD